MNYLSPKILVLYLELIHDAKSIIQFELLFTHLSKLRFRHNLLILLNFQFYCPMIRNSLITFKRDLISLK
jgi:hypothetical protein